MAAPPALPQPATGRPRRTIGRVRLFILAILGVLFLACIVVSWLTRDVMSSLNFMQTGTAVRGRLQTKKTIVDLSPWQTAQELEPLAVTAEERQYAHDAIRLADHDVDQAFASALRQASLQAAHRDLTGEALAIEQRVQKLQELVNEDKALVQFLTNEKSGAGAASGKSSYSDDDLDVAKAQLGLDSDELDDAQNDLNRAIGDNRADIQAELAAHDAVMKKYESQNGGIGETAVISVKRYGTLAGRIAAWFRQNSRVDLLQQAQQGSNDTITRLTGEHNALEAAATQSQAAVTAAHDHDTMLAAMQTQRAQRQILSIYDDRIQTEQQLASVYGKWSAQVEVQHRILLHLILQSVAIVILILMLTILGDAIVRRIMAIPAIDRRQMHTLRTVLEFGVQVVGAVFILLVIFGAPEQTPTILGLATAGITIVLQDFILAFFGWFFLMGKNGIRVGDWVEINGVGGEVIEIGIIYTTLLETGSLNDKGHPTGRRIAFINSFAIRGQYFNFTTSGQWMWDELAIAVPASADPRAFLEKVHNAVLEETQADAQVAEKEWTRAMRSEGEHNFSTTPIVTLRPAASGTEIQARYMTRAANRFDVRNRINQHVVDILREPAAAAS